MQHPFLAVIFAQIRARRPRRPLKLVLLSALAGGCSGSDASEAALASGRYAIVTTLFQADGQTSLLGVIDDPALPGDFDTARAAEIGGAAALFGRDGRSLFAIGSSDSASVTRYVLSDDGVLEPRGALSFSPYGIGSAFKRPELVPFVSDTKAYWIDDTSQQVVLNRALVAAPPGSGSGLFESLGVPDVLALHHEHDLLRQVRRVVAHALQPFGDGLSVDAALDLRGVVEHR
jgi:hypothetical protein